MDGSLQRGTLDLRGRPAGYWRWAGAEGAPRVLLIHGLGASSHIWEPLARALPAGLELVALDLVTLRLDLHKLYRAVFQ